MKFIVSGQESALDPHEVGAGAAALAALAGAGLRIAPWFAVLPGAARASLNPWQAQALAKARAGVEIADLLAKVAFGPSVQHELERALRGLNTGQVSLRVAEHAALELWCVPLEKVPLRIVELWQRALREQPGLQWPAVLVQAALPADASCRTVAMDVQSGSRRRTSVFARLGLAAEASAPEDFFLLDESGALVEARPVRKTAAFLPVSAGGAEARALPAEVGDAAALDAARLREIAALTRRATEAFGSLLELEWLLVGDEPWLTTARPRGGESGPVDPESHAVRWDRAPAERLVSGDVSPLTFSVLRESVGRGGGTAWMGGRIWLRDESPTAVPAATADLGDAESVVASIAKGLSAARVEELLRSWRDCERLEQGLAESIRVTSGEAESSLLELAGACEKNLGERGLAYVLVASLAESPLTRSVAMFQKAADTLQTEEEVVRTLASGSPNAQRQALESLEEKGRLALELAHGPDSPFPGDLGLDLPSFAEEPEPLWRALGTYALGFWRAPYRPPSRGCAEAVQRAEQIIETKLGGLAQKPRRWALQRALKEARDALEKLDVLDTTRRRLSSLRRRLFAEWGRRLQSAGALRRADTIRWLTAGEIAGFVGGGGVDLSLERVAAGRAAEVQAPIAATVRAVETRGPVLGAAPLTASRSTARWALQESRSGTAGSAGSATGRVRLLHDARGEFLEQGDILVARAIEPGWAIQLAACAAIIVEVGSVADAVARLARWLGVPFLTGVTGASEDLQEGDWITVDASLGAVTRVQEPAPQAEGEALPEAPVLRLPPSRFGPRARV